MMRSYVILIANDSDSMANDSDYIYIYGPVLRLSTPPHGLGPQVAAPIPFYLQAIGSISEVQLRIC